MSSFYTPRDLAREMGQSPLTARRVMAEAGITHRRGEWWRVDLSDKLQRLTLEQVRRELANPDSKRRYGCRRRRSERVEVRQLEMF